jgi:ATP-dependent DNA helicase DinG
MTPELARVLRRADSTLESVRDRLRQISDNEGPERADACDRIMKLITASRRLMGTVWDPDETSVRWLQAFPLEVCVTPVSPARELRRRLFTESTTVILTSATLRTGGSFANVERMLGVPEEHEAVVAPSPFDFPHQGVLFLAQGMPDPRKPEFALEAQRVLALLIRAAGGRTLALFTSISAMRNAHQALAGKLGVMAYCQGEMPQQRLIQAFREDERSCLFATMGYWQGVDVAGSSLSLVVIDKLPFEPPGHPVTQARQKLAESHGHSAFHSVSLPPVAMTLTQGVGRLIRTTHDTGMVAILDPRMSTARYRHLLLKGLPPMPRVTDMDEAVRRLREMTGTR